MNKRISRVISLVLCIVMCFSCTVFASEPISNCNHIKGELVLDINSENFAKALLDLGGNKEEDIEMFFYDGPLDFYYQEEQLYEDSKNGVIELVTNKFLENSFIKDCIEYFYKEELSEISNNFERTVLEKEIYEEMKYEMLYAFGSYYEVYPYLYQSFKNLEYDSIKIVYDIYTYLPEKINTEAKLTFYFLSEDMSKNIAIPIHFIVDENGCLINSDIVLTLLNIASKTEPTADFASIEYRNLLSEQLMGIDYLEITFEETDIEEFEIFTENKVYFDKFVNDLLNVFKDFKFEKYIYNGNEVKITSESLENLFEDFLIFGYKNYNSIYDSVFNAYLNLYVNLFADVDLDMAELEGYSKEEIIEIIKESFVLSEEEKAEIDLEIKSQIFMLLNALNNSSENTYIKKDLESIYNKVKEYEKAKNVDDLLPCNEEDACLEYPEPMNCLPYYRYSYETVDEYIYEYLLDEELFELFTFFEVLKEKTNNSYYSSKNNIDLLKGVVNFENDMTIMYSDYELIKVINKYTIDNKENRAITTDLDKKCDYYDIEFMIKTVENIICPIDKTEITYSNFESDSYNWCNLESTHFDSSITKDYYVEYTLVDNSFYIDVDYIDAYYNLKLTEKLVDGKNYFVSILNEEEVLLGSYIKGTSKYIKVRDLEKLGYSIDFKIELGRNIITISK